jgi:hypothetical protein
MQADAVFFRDPFDHRSEKGPTTRIIQVLVLAAILLGFYDLALEAATQLEDEAEVAAAIKNLAAVSTASITDQLAAILAKVKQHPEDAAVYLGQLVDALRDFHTYHEIRLG